MVHKKLFIKKLKLIRDFEKIKMFNVNGTYKPEFRGVFELFRENIKMKLILDHRLHF